jgi:hypothetical protein
MIHTTARLTGLAGALVAGTLLLAGCADDSSDTAHNGPMMGNSDTSDSASDGAEGTFNDADVAFARDMIPHHRQAIQMARLAEGQAADPRVLALADRIEAAQLPEIDTLSGWLADWDADTGHMDGGMGGMMSEQDMHADDRHRCRVRPAVPRVDDRPPRGCRGDGRNRDHRRAERRGDRAGRVDPRQPDRRDRRDGARPASPLRLPALLAPHRPRPIPALCRPSTSTPSPSTPLAASRSWPPTGGLPG